MATGGGYRKEDHDKRWPSKSPQKWRQALPDSQSSEQADDPDGECPDQELENDLSDLSLHREDNQNGLIIPGDQVRQPFPITDSPSEEESEASNYASASEANQTAIFVTKNKGAIPKTSTPKVTTKKAKNIKKSSHDNLNTDTPPINRYFCRTNKVGETVPSPVPPPNILDWYERVDNDAHKYDNTPLTVLGRLEPLPQRSPSPGKTSKRKRINSNGKSITTATSKDSIKSSTHNGDSVIPIIEQPNTVNMDEEDNIVPQQQHTIPWLLDIYPADQPLPEDLVGKRVRFREDNKHTRDNNNPTVNDIDIATTNSKSNDPQFPSNLQEGDRDFLQIPEDAHPFFKRSRGCLSAASRADCRASHLEEMVEREIALPWALRLEPIPGYLLNISPQLIRIQKRNAIALEREAAKLLRRSCTHLTTQGTLNWNIVANFYGKDDAGLEKARRKMDSMVAKDFTKEQDKLEDKKDFIFDHPVTNDDITENLKIRGYFNPNRRGTSPTRAQPVQVDNQAPNDQRAAPDNREQPNNNRPPPMEVNHRQPARAKRRRSNSRSRSRSPNRGRGGYTNRNYQRPNNRGGHNRGRGRGQNRNRGGYPDRNNYYQGPPNIPDPDQLGAIIRQVVEHMNYPAPQQARGRDYRN